MSGIPHRYLTEECHGVGGAIKETIEDFQVDEVPLYTPTDLGEHAYFEIRKVDISTLEVVERIARLLDVPTKDIGYAGLKDRKGITRQTLSVRRVPPERVLELRIPQVEVLWARRHGNKLRVGHLRGNRFRIRVRGVAARSGPQIARILDRILERGMPNYYGPQRFGSRGDAFLIGGDLLRHRHESAVRRILGFPSRSERNPHVLRARRLFMAGDFAGSLESFPSNYRTERRLLAYMRKAGENYKGAVRRISESIRKIFFSAYQSSLFNSILARRLELSGARPGKLFAGDLAYLHRNGAVFTVVDPEAERGRARAFEISPSGPLFGKMMPIPDGLERQIENEVLRREGVRASLFNQLMPALHMRGGRRPFRVPVRELKWELEGRDLLLEFFLPKGSYATTLLREIQKTDRPPETYYTQAEEDLDAVTEADLGAAFEPGSPEPEEGDDP